VAASLTKRVCNRRSGDVTPPSSLSLSRPVANLLEVEPIRDSSSRSLNQSIIYDLSALPTSVPLPPSLSIERSPPAVSLVPAVLDPYLLPSNDDVYSSVVPAVLDPYLLSSIDDVSSSSMPVKHRSASPVPANFLDPYLSSNPKYASSHSQLSVVERNLRKARQFFPDGDLNHQVPHASTLPPLLNPKHFADRIRFPPDVPFTTSNFPRRWASSPWYNCQLHTAIVAQVMSISPQTKLRQYVDWCRVATMHVRRYPPHSNDAPFCFLWPNSVWSMFFIPNEWV
jgi:hypothetical protein